MAARRPSGPIQTPPAFVAYTPGASPAPCCVCGKGGYTRGFRCLKCLEDALCSPDCVGTHDRVRPSDGGDNCRSRSQRKSSQLRGLVAICQANDRIAEAVRASRQLLGLLSARNGPTHGSLLEPLRHLRDLMEATEPDMVDFCLRVVRIQEELCGSNSAPVAEALNDLALVLLAQDRPAEAHDRGDRAMRLVRKLPVSDYQQGLLLSVLATQCRALRGVGRWSEALPLWAEFVETADRMQRTEREAMEAAVAVQGVLLVQDYVGSCTQLLVQDFLTPLDLDDRMLADAERMCDWAIAIHRRHGEEGGEGRVDSQRRSMFALLLRGVVRMLRGCPHDTEEAIRAVAGEEECLEEWTLRAELMEVKAQLCRERGEVAKAAGLWERVRALVAQHRGEDGDLWRWQVLEVSINLSRALLAVGDVSMAEASSRWALGVHTRRAARAREAGANASPRLGVGGGSGEAGMNSNPRAPAGEKKAEPSASGVFTRPLSSMLALAAALVAKEEPAGLAEAEELLRKSRILLDQTKPTGAPDVTARRYRANRAELTSLQETIARLRHGQMRIVSPVAAEVEESAVASALEEARARAKDKDKRRKKSARRKRSRQRAAEQGQGQGDNPNEGDEEEPVCQPVDEGDEVVLWPSPRLGQGPASPHADCGLCGKAVPPPATDDAQGAPNGLGLAEPGHPPLARDSKGAGRPCGHPMHAVCEGVWAAVLAERYLPPSVCPACRRPA